VPKVCIADSMCPCLLVFMQLFFESRTVGASQTGVKTEFDTNIQSRSFKFMHFYITKKLTTECVLLYNNAGLISKVSKEIASKNVENCHFHNPTVV